LNRIVVLWASAKLPGLLSNQEKRRLVESIVKQQQPDGGWNLARLGTWQRSDHTPQQTESDGYATGLVTLALARTHAHRARTMDAPGSKVIKIARMVRGGPIPSTRSAIQRPTPVDS